MVSTEAFVKCPVCITRERVKAEEGAPIICSQCNINYLFWRCLYCESCLYFREPANRVIFAGARIQCLERRCKKVFFLTFCPSCKNVRKVPIDAGGSLYPVECWTKGCNFQYLNVPCPIKNCFDSRFRVFRDRATNFPDGLQIKHEGKIIIIIDCRDCKNQIVFTNEKKYFEENEYKGRYFDGQRIVCPYEFCRSTHNPYFRVVCRKCLSENFFESDDYENGKPITCQKCGYQFCIIVCNYCYKTQTFSHDKEKNSEQYFLEGKGFTCTNKDCKQKIIQINCFYCKRINSFKNFLVGQTITCAYPDCGIKFTKVLCERCKTMQYHLYNTFSFGKKFECTNRKCKKNYVYLRCPKCSHVYYRNVLKEDVRYKCPHKNCGVVFFNCQCPFCYGNIAGEAENFEIGQRIKCPYKNCQKIFSFYGCSKCNRMIFSTSGKETEGEVLQCPDGNCQRKTALIRCSNCKTTILLSGQETEVDLSKDRRCLKCQTIIKPMSFVVREIYKEGLHCINDENGEEKKGEIFPYGKMEEDYNVSLINKLIIKEPSLYNEISKVEDGSYYSSSTQSSSIKSGSMGYREERNLVGFTKMSVDRTKCILCQRKEKQSAFVPCGHRCVCGECAYFHFTKAKACPKCLMPSRTYIDKIYD